MLWYRDGSCAAAGKSWRWNWRKKATTRFATTRRSQWQRNLFIKEMKTDTSAVNIDRDIVDFHYKVIYGYDAFIGLVECFVNHISGVKLFLEWVREFRLKALQTFDSKSVHTNWAFKVLEATEFNKN